MDHESGRDTPDSGIYSPDDGSRRSSFSSTDQSNAMHSRRSSTDSGIGGNPSRDGKSSRSQITDLDTQMDVVSALTAGTTEEGMPEITEELESSNLMQSSSRTNVQRFGNKNSDSKAHSKRLNSAQSIQVLATGPNNKVMPLNINTCDSVDALIRHVSRAFGLGSSENAYLVFEGKTLNLGSDLTVEKAGIKNGGQIQLITRVLGGVKEVQNVSAFVSMFLKKF